MSHVTITGRPTTDLPNLRRIPDTTGGRVRGVATVEMVSGTIVGCHLPMIGLDTRSVSTIGDSVAGLHVMADRDTIRNVLVELAAGRSVYGCAVHLNWDTASPIPVVLDAVPLLDRQGQFSQSAWTWRDLDERRTMSDGTAATLWSSIVENSMAVVYAKDLQGRFILVNRRFEDLFHLSREEILGRTDFEIFPKEFAERFRSNDLRVQAEGSAVEFEETVPQADGQHTYISLKFPIHDVNGERIAICGISSDITARKAAEAALAESDLRLRQLTENLRECVWITEVGTWKVLYVSPAFEAIWGRSCENLYSDPDEWIAAIHPDDRDWVRQAFVRDAPRGVFQEEYRIVRPNGDVRWISDRGVAIPSATGTTQRIAGIAEDITVRKELEREILGISEFERQRISRDLHDCLGQELTGLTFLAKSLVTRLAPRHLPEAQTAQLIADGIQQTVREVRTAIRGLTPVQVDTHGLQVALEQLSASTAARFGVQCDFVTDKDAEVADYDVATQLYRIAQEAIHNAVKYAAAARLTVELRRSGTDIVMQIRDDGRGMEYDAASGAGMGLRIMRYRCGMIAASFDIQSAADQGTVITCKRKATDNVDKAIDLHHGADPDR